MALLPYIFLTPGAAAPRPKGDPSPRGGLILPGRAAQAGRLKGRFDSFARKLGSPKGLAELRADPGSIAPERALVFELADIDPEIAYRALKNIPGFEFLGDDEDETGPPEHGFAKRDKQGKPKGSDIAYRFYFAMPDEQALKDLLALWNRYENGEPFGRAETPKLTAWRDVFDHLKDIRPWGPRDRIPEDAVEAWVQDLREMPEEMHRIEVEFWYRKSPEARKRAMSRLRKSIEKAGGRVLIERVIDEIYYHGALIEVPAAKLRELAEDGTGEIVCIDEVMFYRPQTLASIPRLALPQLARFDRGDMLEELDDDPLVAVFDGVPLARHNALNGRLVVEDPLNLGDEYGAVSEMVHGTAMASIVIHGDAHSQSPVRHRLYVRPLLVSNGHDERFPSDELAVYRMYEALQRMLAGVISEDGEILAAASAPQVRIVNLSIGDPKRRFAGVVSPWARLLDYFAFRYRVLFVISAGNVSDPLEVPGVNTFRELEDLEPEERTDRMLGALFAARGHRRVLSPAEAINVLTVGARHCDQLPVEARGVGQIDPLSGSEMANVSSAVGTGAARVIKPDILMDGGRETVQLHSTGDGTVVVRPSEVPGRFFGIGAAAPGLAGELDRSVNVSGTSPAAALATHEALRIEQALREMDGVQVDPEFLAVVLKCLLAHGAAWNVNVADLIGRHARESGVTAWQHLRAEKGRFLGLGTPRVGRMLGCTLQRALILSVGQIENEMTVPHEIPLPTVLSAKGEWRAVTASLAWLTPVHPRHGAYRRAALDLDLVGFEDGKVAGSAKIGEQPHEALTNRGTLIHRRWEGSDPAVLIENQGFIMNVTCRSPTDGLDEVVPYALAVTLEVGETSAIDVYTEIEARVRAAVPVVIKPQGS